MSCREQNINYIENYSNNCYFFVLLGNFAYTYFIMISGNLYNFCLKLREFFKICKKNK